MPIEISVQLTAAPEPSRAQLRELFYAVLEYEAKRKRISSTEMMILKANMRAEKLEVLAERLNISPNTFRVHLVNIYRKFGVNRKSELIAYLLGEYDQ